MPWTADLEKMAAVHDSGLVVKFKWNPDERSWDGKPLGKMPPSVTPDNAARLMREAGDAFAEALRESTHKYRCVRCGHGWDPRKPGRPPTCPCCRTPFWDGPRK